MAHSYHHALSSARRFGGTPEDYLPLHSWMDSSKSAWCDQRHRAVLHHSFGVYLAEETFGLREEVRLLRRALARVPRWVQRMLGIRVPATRPVTLATSNGKSVPIRLLAEQHVQEDCGFIPTLADYLAGAEREPWMYRGAAPLHRINAEGQLPPLTPTTEAP